ncbi:MAG: SLC13 family permease [Desulfobacterales bacterium]|nr:SLC13 family permease [Desulfobacterales bacterium]
MVDLRTHSLAMTALGSSVLCVVLGVEGAKKVFAPYADPIIYLFLGSFMLAEAMAIHGLDKRFAYGIMSLKLVGNSTGRILLAFGFICAFLSMWISNTAATAMMFPIALGIVYAMADITAKQTGTRVDPLKLRFGTGMMLMAAYAASAGGIATPVGTPPNLIGIAMIEKFCGVKIAFFHWMSFALPLLLFLFVLLYFLMYFLHKPEVARIEGGTEFVAEQRAQLGKWTRGQKNALLCFLITVTLWLIPGILALLYGEDITDRQGLQQDDAGGRRRPHRRRIALPAARQLEGAGVHHLLETGDQDRLGHPAALRRRHHPRLAHVPDEAGRGDRHQPAEDERRDLGVGHYLRRDIHRHPGERDLLEHGLGQHGRPGHDRARPGGGRQSGPSGHRRHPRRQLGLHAAGLHAAERDRLRLGHGADHEDDRGGRLLRYPRRSGHLGRALHVLLPLVGLAR